MASVDLSLDTGIPGGTFQLRSRGTSGWPGTVTGDGSVFNGSDGGAIQDYLQNLDGGSNFTIDRLHYRFDVGGDVPADATITAVSLFLYTNNSSQNITDAKYLKSKIAKATSVTLNNAGTAATTWDAIDYSVLHGDYVDVSTTQGGENEFDFGSGDLFDYVVDQHAAGTKAAFWHLTQLEIDAASGGDPPTGANTNQFNSTLAPSAVRPKLTITFTAATHPNANIKLTGGSIKLSGGSLKVGV
tara:strand:- start:72 stop:800 length:729 start_codon:yes stop_codon:yes gene_type:complete